MVTSTMDAVDEGIPNFKELSSKTSCALLWWQAEQFQPIVLRTRIEKDFLNYQSVIYHSD